jgi:hypothetical protein
MLKNFIFGSEIESGKARGRDSNSNHTFLFFFSQNEESDEEEEEEEERHSRWLSLLKISNNLTAREVLKIRKDSSQKMNAILEDLKVINNSTPLPNNLFAPLHARVLMMDSLL